MRLLAAAFLSAIAAALFAGPALAVVAPSFSIADVTVNEAAGKAVLTIVKNGRAKSYSKVRIYTWGAPGTASAGVDYQPINVTLTFGNNQLSQQVVVPLIDDKLVEGMESFVVEMAAERFASISRAQATVTIVDDDVAPPPPPPTTALPAYGDTVVATKACVGSYVPDALIIGRSYKVVGMAGIRPAPAVDPTFNSGVILNPIPDDGVHRGDGWLSLWVLFECVAVAP